MSALYYPISKQITSDSTHVPVGKPIANTNIYILNEHLQLCPIGVIGELYIESIGTAIGYHNQPERTAQSFSFDCQIRIDSADAASPPILSTRKN
ncbi:AMP-binding protein [Bacillus sp. HC-Mk]